MYTITTLCIDLGHNSDDSNDDVDCHLEELLYNEDNGNKMNILHYEQHTEVVANYYFL